MRHSSSSWFGQLGLILGLSVALSGCAVDPRDAGDDIVTGTPGGNESDRCVRGETRCYGGALQSCDSGTYKTSKVCGTGQICDPKRGCLDCCVGGIRDAGGARCERGHNDGGGRASRDVRGARCG